MERIVETPIYKINSEKEKTLIYTIIEIFNNTIEIINEVETTISELIQTKRLMPNGDYYIINGNIEEYVPINPLEKLKSLEEKIALLILDVEDLKISKI